MDQAATFEVLRGVAQHYDWGSTTAIPELLGIDPDGRPWAELWFGTHHGGAAAVRQGGDHGAQRNHGHNDDPHQHPA